MLMGYTMSKHLYEERIDRLTKIGATIGFGEVVKEAPYVKSNATVFITDTGVIYVVNKSKKFIITVYTATIDEATLIFEGNIPNYLRKRVLKNMKMDWNQQQFQNPNQT